ncbi:MAG: (Fe-S)-binding protein [Chloroflexi bacterium]|nr:(Fe-S)-binding protein [Chloroflexota bacterium]
MINEKAVENVRNYGVCQDTGEKKRKILADIGFPVGQKAEYVIIVGCFQPEGMPHVLSALKNVLDHYKVSYTLLGKEYCCGWMTIGQPAVMSKNEEDIARFKELSRGFILENFKQAKELGAKSIALFCGACEPNYANCRDLTDLEVISYSELIDRYFPGGKLNGEVDYYAGCYRFRRRITDRPVDVEPARRVLNKLDGLKVNYLDDKLCCYIPPHMEQLMGSIKTSSVVNICTGCYFNLKTKLGEKGSVGVKMLPEIVWEAIS